VGGVKFEHVERTATPTAVPRVEATRGPELPFTGAPEPRWFVIGFALLAGGLVLRRRTASTAGAAVELSTETGALAVRPPRPPRARRPPARRALVLPALALVACGMLLFRRMR
jgi:hypothetical protein